MELLCGDSLITSKPSHCKQIKGPLGLLLSTCVGKNKETDVSFTTQSTELKTLILEILPSKSEI
jgi:hypothetical protein